MLFDMLFNTVSVIIIVGAPLAWIVGWLMIIVKADRFVHRQFEPPPYVLTPEEKAAAMARVLKMNAEIERLQAADHHH